MCLAPDIPSASGTRVKSGAKNHFRAERIPEKSGNAGFPEKRRKNPPLQAGRRKNAQSVADAHQPVDSRRVASRRRFLFKKRPF